MANSLRESAGLALGDKIQIACYRAPIEEAKEIVLQQEDIADAPAEREALRYYLQDELCISVSLEEKTHFQYNKLDTSRLA
jgi:hypothetical protein